ncbi:hypothetical protein F52700_9973 [Fusarium sp. NRRL 52700]|nr:hypothetical protein F52700_9973 [Fusarium sp. NRRL 52700]
MPDPATITPAEGKPLENVLMCIGNMALYDDTGSPDASREILTASQIARGSLKPCTSWMRKKRATWSASASLGKAKWNCEIDVRRLLAAFKKLWPQAMNSLAGRVLTTDAIIQLDRGLRMGALTHLTEALPDAIYRPLIFH